MSRGRVIWICAQGVQNTRANEIWATGFKSPPSLDQRNWSQCAESLLGLAASRGRPPILGVSPSQTAALLLRRDTAFATASMLKHCEIS